MSSAGGGGGAAGPMQAAGVAYNLYQQQQAYELSKDLRTQHFRQELGLAKRALWSEYIDLQVRRQQELEASSIQIQNNAEQSMMAMASAGVEFASQGVSGISVAETLRDYQVQALRRQDVIIRQREFDARQLDRNFTEAHSRANLRALNARGNPIAAPDYIGALLGMGTIAGNQAMKASQQSAPPYSPQQQDVGMQDPYSVSAYNIPQGDLSVGGPL